MTVNCVTLIGTRALLLVLVLIAGQIRAVSAQVAEPTPPLSLEAPEAAWGSEQDEVHRYSELPPDAGEAPRKKKESFPGYTKHKERFRHLCEALYEDDRAAVFATIGESHKGGAIGCAACKTFFRLLYSQCSKVPKKYKEITNKIGTIERTLAMKERPKKAKKPKKKKTEDEAGKTREELKQELLELQDELPKKQLEPRLTVIDTALRLSQALADEANLRVEHHKAMELLAQDLSNPAGKSTGELHYFDTFVTYLMSPFEEYAREKELRERIEQKKADERAREFMFDSNQMFGGRDEGLEDLPTE